MAAEELLPLFPLSVVLVPAMPLPLHIFEDRYKEMMAEIIPGGGEFGVVLAKESGIVNIGCSAAVHRIIKRYPDGRLDLIALGQRRFVLNSLDEERSFLRGGVEFFNDEDSRDLPPEIRAKALAAYRLLLQLDDEEPDPEIPNLRMSFRMAQHVLDLDKRQTVLGMRSEIERVEYLLKVIPEYIATQRRLAAARQVAPMNGHVADSA